MKKLHKAKKNAEPLEKSAIIKTHLRNMIIVPEMVGSIVGIYNGKTFDQVEINIWNDLPLPRRVLADLQAGQARPARTWCHPQLPVYSSQVGFLLFLYC